MCTAPSMSSAKYVQYCVLVDGKIFVFERTVGAGRAPNFELFDPDCLSWSRLPALPAHHSRSRLESTIKIQACCVKKTTLYISIADAIYRLYFASKPSTWGIILAPSFHFMILIGYCIDGWEWDICVTTNGNIDSFSRFCRPYKPPECFDWRNASAFPPPPPAEEEKVDRLEQQIASLPPSSRAFSIGTVWKNNCLTPLVGGRGVNGRPRFAIISKGFLLPEDDWNLPSCPHITVDVIEVVKKEVLPLYPFEDGKWSGTYEFFLINKLKSSAYSMGCMDDLVLYGCFSC